MNSAFLVFDLVGGNAGFEGKRMPDVSSIQNLMTLKKRSGLSAEKRVQLSSGNQGVAKQHVEQSDSFGMLPCYKATGLSRKHGVSLKSPMPRTPLGKRPENLELLRLAPWSTHLGTVVSISALATSPEKRAG